MEGNKSTFVTVVAWIFIVGSSIATLVSLMQNIMFHVMLKETDLSRATQDMPPVASFMFGHFQLIVLAFLLISILMLASSIGLLKRNNWARLVFIVVLSLGIIWSLGGVVLQMFMFSSMPQMPPEPQFEQFQTMQSIIQWFAALMGIGIAVLFGWIIKKLTCASVREEFAA